MHEPAEFSYCITTDRGTIPYVIETDAPCFQHPRLVYLDDFLYKDSYYDKGGDEPIASFIGCTTDVYAVFKHKPGVLLSKRGNYKLKKEAYAKFVGVMKPAQAAEYETGRLTVDGENLVEPADLEDFKKLLRSGCRLFGSAFVNEMVAKGLLLEMKEGELVAARLEDSSHEYIKYAHSINEMNASTFLAEHNYQTLHEYAGRR